MPPGRRKRARMLARVLRLLEDLMREARRGQTAGDPTAERSMNVALDDWATTRDLITLAAYEDWVMDHESPDYHG